MKSAIRSRRILYNFATIEVDEVIEIHGSLIQIIRGETCARACCFGVTNSEVSSSMKQINQVQHRVEQNGQSGHQVSAHSPRGLPVTGREESMCKTADPLAGSDCAR